MTKRRSSPESEIATFFQTADPAVALSLFRVVRGILDTRNVFAAENGRRPVRTRKAPATPLVDGNSPDKA